MVTLATLVFSVVFGLTDGEINKSVDYHSKSVESTSSSPQVWDWADTSF